MSGGMKNESSQQHIAWPLRNNFFEMREHSSLAAPLKLVLHQAPHCIQSFGLSTGDDIREHFSNIVIDLHKHLTLRRSGPSESHECETPTRYQCPASLEQDGKIATSNLAVSERMENVPFDSAIRSSR